MCLQSYQIYQLLIIYSTALTMTWTTVIRIFALLFLIGSISADKIPKIIGGNNAVIKDFPYLISIRRHGRHTCGGSIISNRHILTAAHCVHFRGIDGLTIHSGTSRTDRDGNVHNISSVHVHPTFNSRVEVDGSDDIAILTLEEPIVFNNHQQKINLPSDDIQNNQVAYAIGWGRTSTSNWDPAPQLQKLRVAILPSGKCRPFLTENIIDEKQFCTFRSTATGICHGDSGSTLVSHGEVVGIFSRIDSGFCSDGYPDIYNNVFAYKDFIQYVMND